jgi:hypothetical protein
VKRDIGGNPAAMLLSIMLRRHGVDSVVTEDNSQW